MNTIHYILKDHLGSWTTVTDAEGTVEQELSFDAWGNLRDADTWTGTSTETPMFDRGFTGHEHLCAFGLINMNGRSYDPLISSFLSVDAYVQDPSNAQGFNRYAYCLNNPLRYTDPTGWLYLGASRSQESEFNRYRRYANASMTEEQWANRGIDRVILATIRLGVGLEMTPFMMGEERKGGGGAESPNDEWDTSALTPSQRKILNDAVHSTREHSSIFNKMYDALEKSSVVYKLVIGETTDDVKAQYNPNDNTITFRDESILYDTDAYCEEMIHAYQSVENKNAYGPEEFNYEFEAKVIKFFIAEQILGLHASSEGTNFQYMHELLSPDGIETKMPGDIDVDFLVIYRKGAAYFSQWNLQHNYGNSRYKKQTLQVPHSLIRLYP